MGKYLFIIVLLIVSINLISACSLIFIERKEPTTTWAWLIILLIFPLLGIFIYFLFGQNLSRHKIFREKKVIDRIKTIEVKEKLKSEENHKRFIDNYKKLILMNYNHSGALYTSGNDIKVYTNGEKKFKDLINDIRRAKKFIHMQYYIFRFDELGETILYELKKRIDNGVEVRLLVDAMGSKNIKRKQIKKIQSFGINYAVFFPSILPHFNMRINFRNHRKIVVIDGKVGYLGGFNIGNEYINRGKKFKFWRDTHLKIRGLAVNELNKRFLLDWDYASSENIEDIVSYFPEHNIYGSIGMQIISSGPDHLEEYIKNAMMKIINDAKDYVYIQTPYLVPDAPVLEAIKIASLSGVDVRIMVPGEPDHFFMEWMLSANIGVLLDYGVKFYRYQNGFIHSKVIISDGKVSSIGTANLDIRSFKLNFEITAVIYNEEFTKNYERIFFKDQENCKLVIKEEYEKRNRALKIKESLIRLVGPIL